MPMLDNQCNSLDNQENPNIAQALWMNFQSADMNSQWKLCSSSAIQWVNNGALVGFEFANPIDETCFAMQLTKPAPGT